MQCANAPTPFDGRRFFRDLVAELQRLAERDEPPPYYPQRLWFVALATADAKDRFRFVSHLNARDDSTYLERVSGRAGVTAGGMDGFSDTFTHKTAGGTTQIAPQIDTSRAPPTLYDRYKRRYADEKTECQRTADAVRTTF